ncbi:MULTISPECIES: efflux RND transporter permease subunit [unclassified Sphingomonas]|uniref:efflux RND transporter permease subunit n=1 Tax=unclassified Sphingomonas TaxID=196159 RepID=UPI001618A2B1|nr:MULTISPECIES: efflux RND transporter permease subunit [unclassified Sphingomonas]MBB3347365.1 multidrug efflux pump subunit AcrB [Sphingomonas sp. BK069]MBB3472160.1 multidrug efflux pump subunit AcrB [Sphingomonas sp. BK345]
MGFRNISAWSIRNPVPAIVLFVMLTVAGIVSFIRMDINDSPDIDFPAVMITITQPGAAPSELETQVTQRIEAAVRTLEGVDEIQSFVSEGNSTTMVQMAIGQSVDRAVNEARDAVTQIRGNLPEGILEPQVSRVKINDNDLGSYSAIATDMTIEQLSWYIDNTVTKELLSVPGMGGVERNGGVSREIRVILDPARLAAQGLTASQINNQLRQVNLDAPGGRAEIAGAEQSVRVLGNARTAYDLGQTQINVGDGRTIRLADVATVRDLYAEQRSAAAVDGKPVLSFDFKRAKGSSDVTVFREGKKKLEELEKRNPKVKFRLRVDGSKYPLEQYKSAIHAMLEGAILAVVVVFLFLRDWRATVISALAIPLSAIPTFWFMELMGFTLNEMTMLALSLVAGVLVDDAIVEIENIVRHMRMGKTAYQAAIDAADEIGLAVLATTMAIVAVFLPVGLMPGISGQFFKNFGLTVVVAVLMSLAVARLITPMIAAYFLRAGGHVEHGGGPVMNFYQRVLAWTLDEGGAPAARARGGMHRVLGYWRDHRLWVVMMGVGAFLFTLFLFTQIPMSFQPASDQPRSTVTITMPPGSTLETTQGVVDQVYELIRKQPEVESVYTRTLVGSGRVTAQLREKRDKTSTEFERGLAPQLAKIADARVNFQSQFGFGDNNRDISVTLGGDDPVVLRQAADRVVQDMAKMPGLIAPRIAGDLNRPEIIIKPRSDLAANLGVTTAALSNAIRIATIGDIDQNSARFSLSDRQIPIRVALEQSSRSRLATIQNLPVQTQSGGSVPLSLVADIGFGSGPTRIQRINQQRQLTIGADLQPGVATSVALPKIKQLPAMKSLPVGVQELNVGQAKWQLEMLMNFVTAVVSGVFLVFSVLVLLYRRLLPPLVNMGSLLLAPLGGLLALLISGDALSMPVFIGLLMLLGIVAKNSILLIDFALEEMTAGVAPYAAIVDAGRKRAQPIVMTTVAMVAGMVPTALSLSGDGAWRAPMGIVVIGGLTVSTMLTLLIVPAAFSLAIGIERRVGPWLGRRLLTYRPGDEGTLIEHAPHPAIPAPPGRIGFHEDGTSPAE